MKDPVLCFDSVAQRFGTLEVLSGLSFEVHRGEFVALVGPSGCGKTTILNVASGFDKPNQGTVRSQGQIRMVSQRDGLFPWQTVEENIALGLRRTTNREAGDAIVEGWLERIDLEPFRKHYPHQLSGGMRQRVELARALAGGVDLLLLDEPFSALDYLTRLQMRWELAMLLEDRGTTALLVTHDIEEAAQLADRVLVLTPRPANIQYELAIAAPKPRELTHPAVVSATGELLAQVGVGHRETVRT